MIPRTRVQLVFVACLVVASYFAYTAAEGFYRNHQLAEQRDRAEQEVQQLERERAYLEGVYAYVSSDDYVEQQARRELGYAREGETAFVVVGPEPEEESLVAGDWWQRLFPW